jgi:hypothetical protein
MLQEAAPAIPRGSYVIDRSNSAVPRPHVEDVSDKIADLLSEFTEDALRDSFRCETMPIILGVLRSREMFPKSNRFQTRKLVSWENRTRATVAASDGFDVIFDPRFAPIEPYAVMPVQAFGSPLRPVIVEMQKRLRVDPYGFSILWMGSGGYVTPLHHDGDLVHGRWHLVVRGAKQFDFVPPGSRRVPRFAWWDLYRRFSPLYKSPLPDCWLTDGTGAYRVHLAPGQMVTWGRRWWHRVEIAKSGVTIALSTRGYRQKEMTQLRGIAYHLGSLIIGDAERFLEALGDEPPIMTLDQLNALRG